MEASEHAGSEPSRSAAAPRHVHWPTELRLAAVLLAFGVFVLPVAVYAVGLHVIGEYASEDGVAGLLGAVWLDLAAGRPTAWILVVSPYVVTQLARLGLRLWRADRA